MGYDFKELYKEMFTEHWKLSVTMLVVFAIILMVILIPNGIEPFRATCTTLAITVLLVLLKAFSTLLRAKLLIFGCKKGHRLSIQVYQEWIS